jgi:hypothetical protein
MANTIRIKRRASGASGAPSSLENAELAFNEVKALGAQAEAPLQLKQSVAKAHLSDLPELKLLLEIKHFLAQLHLVHLQALQLNQQETIARQLLQQLM